MFNKFIKKSSKLIAIVLALALSFSPLSYADTYSVNAWGGDGQFIQVLTSDGTPAGSIISLEQDINRGTNADGPYNQGTSILTINGNGNTIDGSRESGLSDNHRSIIVSSLTVNDVTIKSFSSNSQNYGGAITVNQSKILTIINSKLQDNISYSGNGSGGAILNNKGKIIVGNGSEFLANGAFNRGGALYNKNSGNIEIGNEVKFTSNFADPNLRNDEKGGSDYGGGAIFNENGTITIGDNVVFDSNRANIKIGGAIDNRSTINIGNNALFENNEAIYGTHTSSKGSLVGGGKGGVIYNTNKITIGNNARFEANTATKQGGAIYNTSTLNIGQNAVFIGNRVTGTDDATNAGGAIYNTGTTTIGDGARFENNINNNSSFPGGAIYNAASKIVNIGTSTFVNNTTNDQKIDIYSVGNLNFQISAGQTGNTTMTGGISNYGDTTRGTTNIKNGVTLMVGYDEEGNIVDGATFSQNQININTNARLMANATGVTATSGIKNEGTLVFNGGTNTNIITGSGSGTGMKGFLTIDGTVTNATGKTITQNSITINSGNDKSFTVNADDITLGTKTISNDGTLIFTGGTNNDNITGDGNLTIDGTVINAEGTTIIQESITVNEDKNFTVNLNDITIGTSGIANEGELTFNGTGTNTSKITGTTGNFIINGTIVNEQGKEINQKTITINSGKKLTTRATDVITTNGISNFGTIDFTSGILNSSIIGASADTSIINMVGDITVSEGKTITNNTITLGNGTDNSSLTLQKEDSLNSSTLIISNGALTILDIENGEIGSVGTDSSPVIKITENANWNLKLDINLAEGTADTLNIAENGVGQGSQVTIDEINVLAIEDGEIYVKIANQKINAISQDIYMSNGKKYRVAIDDSQEHADETWLKVKLYEYTGLADIVEQGLGSYVIPDTIDTDVVSWIVDAGEVQNFLKEDLVITGKDKLIKAASETEGIITNGKNLTINNLSGFEGFNNAINVSADSELTVSTVAFKNNTTTTAGGAIRTINNESGDNSAAKIDIKYSTFTSNIATGENSKGGAIDNYFYNSNTETGYVSIDDTKFDNNQADLGGAIYNHGEKDSAQNTAKMKVTNSVFTKNSAKTGGAVYNAGEFVVNNSSFSLNTATDAAAVYTALDSITTITNTNFSTNTVTGNAGAIYNSGLTAITDSEFYGNEAGSDKYGGAILAGGKSTTTITNTSFMKNKASVGGALFSYSGSTITINNANFSTNTATTYGGAMYAAGDFTVNDSEFYGNSAFKEGNNQNYGGAIYTAATSTSTITNTDFIKNSGKGYGGAIYNAGTMQISNSEFNENEIGIYMYSGNPYAGGGAIATASASSTTITNVTFTRNSSLQNGGAINNTGIMYINDSSFIENTGDYCGGAINNNSTGTLEINNSEFIENHGTDSNELSGGAIFVGGVVKIKDSSFDNNNASDSGGAICSSSGNISDLTISTTTFTNNSAQDAGGVGIFGTALIENSVFTDNRATNTDDTDSRRLGGGAIALGSKSQTVISGSTFSNNYSGAGGGAIGQRKSGYGISDLDTERPAELDITNSIFTGNVAEVDGGAINNYIHRSKEKDSAVYVGDSTFEQNSATYGGAIYNHSELDNKGHSASMYIENSVFAGNVASQQGGAIYNASTMTINNSNFSENTANGAANDIYNTGKLDFLGGKTTMTGGITGTGTTTIGNTDTVTELELDAQATMEQSVLTIEKDSKLSVNAEKLIIGTPGTVDNYVTNQGYLILSSGNGNLGSSITGDGSTTITNGANIILTSDKELKQSDLTIEENSKFTLDLSGTNFDISSDKVTNNGTIELHGNSTLGDDLYGTGEVIFNGNITNDASVNQATVTVNKTTINQEDKTITTNSLQGVGELKNEGTINLTLLGTENSYTLKKLTGDGTTNISVSEDTIIDLTNKIIQQQLILTGDKSLQLEGTASSLNGINVTNYLTGFDLYTAISSLDNNPETGTVDEATVNIYEGGAVTGTITNTNGTINFLNGTEKPFEIQTGLTANITSDIENNKLNIGKDGEESVAGSVVSAKQINSQTITISSGSLNISKNGVEGSIVNSSLTIKEHGKLTANANNIDLIDEEIKNAGIVEFTGGTNDNKISGTGNLTINGTVLNEENNTIEQGSITVTETGNFTANANDITTGTDGIENDGTLIYTGGTNENKITGTGKLEIKGTDSETVIENNADITQKEVEVTSGKLTNAEEKTITATTITNKTSIENSGTITGTNNTVINETGATITNNENATINATTLTNSGTITNEGTITSVNAITNKGTLTSDAENITITGTTKTIINDSGKYNITGGTLSGYNITGTSIENSQVNILNEVTISAGKYISGNTVSIGDDTTAGSLTLEDETSNLNNSKLIIKDGAILITQNNKANDISTNGIQIEDGAEWIYNIDIDLIGTKADKLNISENGVGTDSQVSIGSINLVNNRASKISVIIANKDITNGAENIASGATITGALFDYTVTSRVDENGNTILDIEAAGYGGLAGAIYDGLTEYNVIENPDDTKEWILDNDTLKESLVINGNDNVLTTSTGLSGIKTDIHTLTVTDLTEYSGFENAITVQKVGDESGILNVSTVTFKNNTGTAVIINEGTTNLSNVTFSENNVDSDIANSGELNISGEGKITTLENGITGDGKTTIANGAELVNGTASTINQNEIEVSGKLTNNNENEDVIAVTDMKVNQTGQVTTNASAISSTNEIDNAGVIEFIGGTNENKITGTGNLTINGTVTNETGAAIEQSSITINSEKSFSANVGDITTTDKIGNEGELTFTGTGENKNKITGTGNLTIDGTITNETGKTIEQTLITINNEKSFSANAGDVTTTDKIENEGELIFVGGTNENKITGTGVLTIDGTVTNEADIEQSKVSINENKNLITVADKIVTSKIENEGTVTFTGGTNNNEIDGSGELVINGTVTNTKDVKITQNKVTIIGGKEFTAYIDDIDTYTGNGEIANYGTLNLTGGTNNNVISQAGTLNVDGELTNNNNISQDTININAGMFTNDDTAMISAGTEINIAQDAGLTTNASKINVNASTIINNDGTLIFTGGTNGNKIAGTGELNIDGIVENEAKIEQGTINVAEDKKLTTNADNLVATNGIINKGTMTFTGGKNTNAIDSEFDGYGRIEIAGTVENAAEIYQKDVIVISGKLTNDAEATIYAEYLTNNTEIINSGTINPSNMTNESNASIENTGEINAANITNKENAIINNKENGTIDTLTMINEEGGTINNASDFNVTASFENSGTVTSSGTIMAGELTNYANGIINNEENGKIVSSSLDNKGIINNKSGAEIEAVELTNSGTITSSGTIYTSTMINDTNGTMNNEEDGEIIADSALINNGTISNKSSITARNNITNNENGNITNSENAKINVTRLINSGTITNEGNIETSNEITNSGEITSHAEHIVTTEIKNDGGKYIVTGGTISYKITGNEGKIDIKNNEVTIANDIENNTINLETTLKVKEEDYLKDSSTLAIGGTNSVLDIENGKTGTIEAAVSITAATWELKLDIDLKGKTADLLNNVAENNSTVMITALNILTDKANNDKIKIANTNIVNVFDVIYHFSTEKMNYEAVLTGDENGSYLKLTAEGYGGLANAIYDGDQDYTVPASDTVTAWIEDKNYLTENLEIKGQGNTLTATPESGTLEGIVVSNNTKLTINNLAEFNGFNNALTVNATGELIISTATFKNNTGTAVIANEGTATLSAVTFTDNEVTTDIANNGTLNISGEEKITTLEKGITGQGKTTIASGAELINGTASTINQEDIEVSGKLTNNNETENAISTTNRITVNENAVFTSLANAVIATNGIVNSGTVTFTGGTNANAISGTGEFVVDGAVTNNASVKQSTITINNGKSLTTNADKIRVTEEVTNNGELILTGGTNKNIINGTTGTTIIAENANVTNDNGTIKQQGIQIIGTLTNNNETSGSISVTDKITIDDNGVFTTNASAVVADNGIVNAGTVTFTGGKNTNAINGTDGRLEIAGNVENAANVEQKEIEVTNGKLTNAEENTITATTKTTNSGTIENKGTIITKELTNSENATIGNEGTLTVNEKLTNGGTINNESEITAKDITNSGTIENKGTLTSETEIENKGTLTSNAEDISITGQTKEIKNDGIYNITGGKVSDYSITGENGTINIENNEVIIGTTIEGNNVNLGTKLILEKEDYLTGSELTIKDGATLNTINDSTATVTTDKITIASGANWNLQLDIDLKTATGDNLVNVTNLGDSQATINDLNILSDKAEETKIQIADAYINAVINPSVYTTNIRYEVKAIEENDKTYLSIVAVGYGGLANAIYDGAKGYNVTENIDCVTEWIEDPIGTTNNFLKEDLTIKGQNNVLKSTTGIEGIRTSTHTLTIKTMEESQNLEISGFKNVITVEKQDDLSGTLEVSSVTFTNNSGDAVIINEGKVTLSSVTFNDNNVKADISNNGELTITGNGATLEKGITGEGNTIIDTGATVINGEIGTISQNEIEVSGTLINNNEKNEAITANDITIGADGSLLTNASAVRAENGIDSDGLITFTGGTNRNEITGEGEISIVGDVINSATVQQNAITVAQDASLTANANDIKTENGIVNIGNIIFTEGTNENVITGTGELNITGTVINSASVQQSTVTVAEGANLTTDASNIETEIKITSSGDLIFTGGTNNNVIEGTGNLEITGDVVNSEEGNIKQNTVTIDEQASLDTNVNNIAATNGIANDGALTYTGDGENKNDIEGTGTLTVKGKVVNANGTEINQSAITITEEAEFTANANDITTGDGIINDGILTYTDGVNTNTITMSDTGNKDGILKIAGDLENAAEISQLTIRVEDDVTFTTDAGNLKDITELNQTIDLAQSSILKLTDNDVAAILTANIQGTGSLVKIGAETVTLTGDNTYSGTTTITEGAIEIVSSNEISKNTIYMDGGKLIINGDSNVELKNEIIGTQHNDVNIEVENFIGSLFGKIIGNENLVKTGDGILALEMESNSYVGDTIIKEGGIRGTTSNINGKIIGSGDNKSLVNFCDDSGEVVLNEIDTTNFIGDFLKTGRATMEVINNFKATYANIGNGTFIINNDASMGGSGSTFEVTGMMRVEYAQLKGYGDITAGDLIIGSGATFAPGNSTTTFKVNGNLIFEDNGNYDVEFGQTSMEDGGHYNDNTSVTGTTTIGEDATITLNNLEGKYYVAETIELINSGTLADGYEYKEGNVVFNDNDATDLKPGYDTRISTRVYTEGNVLKIELQRKQSEYGTATDFDKSQNEQEAADAIDAISTGNGGDITLPLDVLEHFYYYEDPETGETNIPALKAALNDVAGVIHANSTLLPLTNAKIEHVYDKLKDRSNCPHTCVNDRVWAEYYYNTYQVNENENSPKFETNVNGFLVGFDIISSNHWEIGEQPSNEYAINGKEKGTKGYKVNGKVTTSKWNFGLMGGYGTSELKQRKDKTIMKDFNLGFYSGYENENWLLKGMLLGGYEQYNIDRTIGFMNRMANSEHNGYSATLDLEAGYKIGLTGSQARHQMYLKPFVGITGSYMNNEGYKETGAESLNLKIEDYDSLNAQARVGFGINGRIKKFGWYAKAGIRRLLMDDYSAIDVSLLDYSDQTKMRIRSAQLDKFSYGGGLGADFALSNAWTIFANGLASFAEKSTNYYGNIGLMYKFGCTKENEKTDDTDSLRKATEDKLRRELQEKENALKAKERELQAAKEKEEQELRDAKAKEKELQDKIKNYETKIVSEEQAQKMKEKTIKSIRLEGKPTFKFGTSQLNNNGKESLKKVAKELEKYPDAELLIEGHTDSVGSDEVNQRISEERAAAMAKSLKKDYKVPNDISVIGKGEKEPIASNATKEGRAKNRRVEIILTTAE